MSRGPGDVVEMRNYDAGPRPVIVFGVPTFGQVSIWWAARAFQNLRHPMNTIVRSVIVAGLEVGHARNELVARALDIERQDPALRCTHVFFLDDDVLVHPDAMLKLLADKRPIVSGLYYAKTSVPIPLVLHGEYAGTTRGWMPGDLVDCWGHGMGLTLVETEVFRRLRDETPLGVDDRGYPAWFATTRDAALVTASGVPAVHNQTEDVAFLRKAAALGYQPCVDTSAAAFGFHWAQAEQRAYPLRQWTEYRDTGRITWDTDAGPVVWEAA